MVVCFGVVAAVMGAWMSTGAAWAQEGATARVTADRLNFRESCGMEAPVQGVLTAGAEIELLGEPLGEDGWVRVRDADGREGCVSARYIEVTGESAPSSTLEEVAMEEPDLEAERARMAAEEERREAELRAREAELDDQVAEEPRRAEYRMREERQVSGFVDVSVGYAAAADDEYAWRTLIDPNAGGGVTDDRVTYNNDDDLALAVGGGVLWEGSGIGAGLRVSRQTHEGPADIDLFSTFAGPPFQVEAHARTAEDLEREELALHASFIWAPVSGESFLLRLMVGPSYFDISQETVDGVAVTENPFRIVSFRKGEQDETTIGWHVGLDASYYWGHSGRYGVGVTLFHAQGDADGLENGVCSRLGPPDPSLCEDSVDTGGTQLMGGLRLRF